MTACDHCQADAAWLIFAAYPVDETMLRSYPAPMSRVCAEHLGHAMTDDMIKPGSTAGFYVRPA